MTTQSQLKQLMADYNLSRKQVAEICKVQLSTVDGWLSPTTSTRFRQCPEMAIKLIECTYVCDDLTKIDRARIEKALSEKPITLPPGLTTEQKRQFILSNK